MGQLRFDAPPYRQGIPFTREIVGYIGVVLIATGVIAICPLNIARCANDFALTPWRNGT